MIGGALVQVDWRWVFWINVPVGVAAVVLAVRVVPESKDPNVSGRPDLLGAGLLAAAVGLVALALVEGARAGAGVRLSFLGLLAASLACGAAMVYRSRRHHSPVIELELLRSRTFSGSFAASILYYAGFGAFVLSAVEFLTGVWHYSAVEAGLAIAPGPLMVLPFARLVAPRLAALLGGPGRVAVIGCFVNALAQALWLWRIQVDAVVRRPTCCPPSCWAAAGVGLTIPSLLGAGSASLTPARFGTGSGILNTARQVGTVLGRGRAGGDLGPGVAGRPARGVPGRPGAGHRVLRGRGGGVRGAAGWPGGQPGGGGSRCEWRNRTRDHDRGRRVTLNRDGLRRRGPGEDGEGGPLALPAFGLGLVDPGRGEDRVGAHDQVEHVGQAVRGVDAPAAAGFGADAEAGGGGLVGVDGRLGGLVRRARMPNFSGYHRWTRAWLRICTGAGRSPNTRCPAWMTASSAAQDRSEASK